LIPTSAPLAAVEQGSNHASQQTRDYEAIETLLRGAPKRVKLVKTPMKNQMKWYWQVGGGHTHVRVFMNGGKCGDLCFRNEEFEWVKKSLTWVQFVPEEQLENSVPYDWCSCSKCGWKDQFRRDCIKNNQASGHCDRCDDERTFIFDP